VTGDEAQRIASARRLDQRDQAAILRARERSSTAALELDADGEVVAGVPAKQSRTARMPGPLLARNELHEFAMPAQQKMR